MGISERVPARHAHRPSTTGLPTPVSSITSSRHRSAFGFGSFPPSRPAVPSSSKVISGHETRLRFRGRQGGTNRWLAGSSMGRTLELRKPFVGSCTGADVAWRGGAGGRPQGPRLGRVVRIRRGSEDDQRRAPRLRLPVDRRLVRYARLARPGECDGSCLRPLPA
jgi:hypothetical protein